MTSGVVCLRRPRILGKKRTINLGDGPLIGREICEDRHEKDLVRIVYAIRNGGDLEPFYRKGIDDGSPDLLLTQKGIMHLHLGGKSSDVLLYLIQFDEYVVFLEIGSHHHLDDIPPGKKFPNHYMKNAQALVQAAMDRAQADAECNRQKLAAAKARLLSGKRKI